MKTMEIFGENRHRRATRRREASRAVIFQDGRLLLTHLRAGDVSMLPGGGLEAGETPEQACAREVREETGLVVRPAKRYLALHEYYEEWDYVTYYFVCEPAGTSERALTEAERSAGLETRWSSFGDALELFSHHPDFAETSEEKRGIYLREYTALTALFERCPAAASGDVSRLLHPPAHTIVPLPREEWALHPLPFEYDSDGRYDVKVSRLKTGFQFRLTLRKTGLVVPYHPLDEANPDRLYQPWWEKAQAWGVVEGGELKAVIETCPEEWSNRLQVTELWVSRALRGDGVGQALMRVAKEQTVREKRRALILETQTSNVHAIGFYLHEGFTPIGLDTCAYTNRDVERGEVRLNLAWFPDLSDPV